MAFCTNCGSQLEENASFCSSCGTSVNGTSNSGVQTQQVNGAYGLGGAIASAVLGFVGMIFSLITYIVGIGAGLGHNDDVALVAIVLGIIGAALNVVALILGIKAIGAFKKGRALGAKPIGTLIVGIGGVSLAGFGLLFTLIGFIMAATAL